METKEAPICICGKTWNSECALSGLFGSSMRVLDTTKLTDEPEYNRALIEDNENYLPFDGVVHKIRPVRSK